jgi:oligoribonuclease (3'-5' exoribonuclease)
VAHKPINALAWVDLETTGLPEPGDGIMDYRDLHMLEVAVLVTDLDLQPITGYHEVVRMTPEAGAALKKNDFVREMHMANHLVRDCVKSPDALTLEELDAQIHKMFQEKTAYDPGEFAIAGSGVARFDHPIIDVKMPMFSRWLHYAEIDIGSLRRGLTTFNFNQPVVNPLPESSRDGNKTHRAWDDVNAHLKEAQRIQAWVRKAAELV